MNDESWPKRDLPRLPRHEAFEAIDGRQHPNEVVGATDTVLVHTTKKRPKKRASYRAQWPP